MAEKILVAYATGYGATGEVAEEIGRVLRAQGTEVDVRPAQDVKDISPYRAVVLGSSVRAGRLLTKAVRFVSHHKNALNRVPVAYFLVCLTMSEDTPENRATASGYLEKLCAEVKPVDEALFGGTLPANPRGFGSFIVRAMYRDMARKGPTDFRNWDAIRAWAAGLPAKLNGVA